MMALTGKRTRTRRLFGVMAALWVSLGVQPCAIAAVSDLDCAHRAPSQEQSHGGMHEHHSASDSSGQSSEMASDCCESDEGTVGARQAFQDLKPVGDGIAGPPSSFINISRPMALVSAVKADPPDRLGSAIPLHILYCVYLD